ncbi:LegC family aminotransferase [Fodinicurvata sp. EGI_FJ10296]|uniref:LegC family aminotransferase n=1 Tax=Fodinicurvata sp. EGI_FJ10296 TaxID=3231908 RepID=UPI003451EA75
MAQAKSAGALVDPAFESSVVAKLRSVLGDSSAMTPLHAPEFSGNEWELVKDCLDSGWVSSVGTYVDRFEREIAALSGAEFGIAVVNGTAALHVALIVAGVQPDDEVIVPTLTFVATANAVRHAGAVPHFVDSSPETLGMDPAALAQHLSTIAERKDGRVINRDTGRPIAAVVPMHTFGHPVDMDPLLALADEWRLPVVEDATESLGSHYKGRPCGGLGAVGTLSFNGNKILTTGGGGAIVTNDPEIARRAKHLTTTAKTPHRWAFLHDEVAYNYRMPNINAALGCAQLSQLGERIARKRHLARQYIEAFDGIDGISAFREPSYARSNYWLNTLLLDTIMIDHRDPLLAALNDANLMCRPVWTLMHRLEMFADCPRAPLKVAENLESRIINVPSSAALGTSGEGVTA